jgi:hypothetical protein
VGTRVDLRQKSFLQQLLEIGGFQSPQTFPQAVAPGPGSMDIRFYQIARFSNDNSLDSYLLSP